MHLPVELCWDTYMPPILYDNTCVCTSKKCQHAALDVSEDAGAAIRSVLKFAFGAYLLVWSSFPKGEPAEGARQPLCVVLVQSVLPQQQK